MIKSLRRAVALAAFALGVSTFAAPASAVLLTFSEFAVGTVVTNQYAGFGVIFAALTGNAPIIANDGAMPGSPVLSPNPVYSGDFQWTFTGGATGVQFDAGFWNVIGTGVIDVYDVANNLLASLSNTAIGPEHFDLTALGTIGRITFDSAQDPAGADIDNLQFNRTPEPGSILLLGVGLALLGVVRRRKA